MKLRSGKIIVKESDTLPILHIIGDIDKTISKGNPIVSNTRYVKDKYCIHDCSLSSTKLCCECSDKRPKEQEYRAFTGSYLANYSIVSRHYRYCPTCKDRLDKEKNNKRIQHDIDFKNYMAACMSKWKDYVNALKAE